VTVAAAVDVAEVRALTDRFRCEPYACVLSAGACVGRQARVAEIGDATARTTGMGSCVRCAVGARIAAQVGTAERPVCGWTKGVERCTRTPLPGETLCEPHRRSNRIPRAAPPPVRQAAPKKLSVAEVGRLVREEIDARRLPSVDEDGAYHAASPRHKLEAAPLGADDAKSGVAALKGAASNGSSTAAPVAAHEETEMPTCQHTGCQEDATKPTPPRPEDGLCQFHRRSRAAAAARAARKTGAPVRVAAKAAPAPPRASLPTTTAPDASFAEIARLVDVVGIPLLRVLAMRIEASR
jgi:hypothetical protein